MSVGSELPSIRKKPQFDVRGARERRCEPAAQGFAAIRTGAAADSLTSSDGDSLGE